MRIVDYTEEYAGYVASCTHNPSNDLSGAAKLRGGWINEKLSKGLIIKIAIDNETPVGFIHCIRTQEMWGVEGEDVMLIPCLTLNYQNVYKQKTGSGYGSKLVESVEEHARRASKGIAVPCLDMDFWFMPYKFFEKLGYVEVERDGSRVLMFKKFADVENPRFSCKPYLKSRRMEGKVVIDAYWTASCATPAQEILNLREACREYQDAVVLNEHTASLPRAFLINGSQIEVGPATSTERFRDLISAELRRARPPLHAPNEGHRMECV